jgi:hypothetical protein
MKKRNFNDKLLQQNVSTIRNPLILSFLIRRFHQLTNTCPIPDRWLNVSRRQWHDPYLLTFVHHRILPTSTANQKLDLHCKFLEYCIMDKVQKLGNPKCNMPHQKTPHLSVVTCGWLDWNWNNFISYFNQLYHSNINVFHCCIGMYCVSKLLFYYFTWILLYDCHSSGDFVHVL